MNQQNENAPARNHGASVGTSGPASLDLALIGNCAISALVDRGLVLHAAL